MEEMRVFDFQRIFFGSYPLTFLLEIIFRTCIMYAYTIILLRFLGKRSMGQLSYLELAIIISFGSAIGDPMIGAEVPILYGITAVTTIALIQAGMEKLIIKNVTAERAMEGVPECLVDNGVVLLHKLSTENLSREDLFRSLRIKEVFQLGEVNKAYFETSGDITVLFHAPRHVKAGLCILPAEDVDKPVWKATQQVPETAAYSYLCCGYTQKLHKERHFPDCPNCGKEKWTEAVRDA